MTVFSKLSIQMDVGKTVKVKVSLKSHDSVSLVEEVDDIGGEKSLANNVENEQCKDEVGLELRFSGDEEDSFSLKSNKVLKNMVLRKDGKVLENYVFEEVLDESNILHTGNKGKVGEVNEIDESNLKVLDLSHRGRSEMNEGNKEEICEFKEVKKEDMPEDNMLEPESGCKEVQRLYEEDKVSENVVSPKESDECTYYDTRKEEVGRSGEKCSIQLRKKKFSLVTPTSSPDGNNMKRCDAFDSKEDEDLDVNFQNLKLQNKQGSYITTTLSGGSAKGSKVRKVPAKAGSSRQSMIQLSSAVRGGGGGRGHFMSPVKKGKFVSSGSGGSLSNLYCIRIKNQNFLVVFAEDGIRQMNYRFPGTQRKAWCTAFERDLRNESAWSSGEVSPICSIVKRRDIREPGDVFLSQRANPNFHMKAYLCPMDGNDTPAGICNQIVAKLNEYAANARNNMRMFRFINDTTEAVDDDDLHALDYWLLTKDIVTAIGSLYEEEIEDETFYEFEGLVDGLFERAENIDNVRETLAGHM